MKKVLRFGFVAFAVVAFTACGTDSANTTDTDVIESTDQVESTMDATMDADTAVVIDTPVTDGVVEDIQEEQPPVQ